MARQENNHLEGYWILAVLIFINRLGSNCIMITFGKDRAKLMLD